MPGRHRMGTSSDTCAAVCHHRSTWLLIFSNSLLNITFKIFPRKIRQNRNNKVWKIKRWWTGQLFSNTANWLAWGHMEWKTMKWMPIKSPHMTRYYLFTQRCFSLSATFWFKFHIWRTISCSRFGTVRGQSAQSKVLPIKTLWVSVTSAYQLLHCFHTIWSQC